MCRGIFCLMTWLAFIPGAVHATTHEFYKGKTLRIIVGYAAGGGYDLYSRTMARHMVKHIPGQPTMVVENMAGAGSLIAANHVYNVAKPDGLTVGHFSGVLFLGQVLGQKGIEFDALKFEHMGAPAKIEGACAFTKASGINSIEKWMAAKTAPKMGATAPGTVGHDVSKILVGTLAVPMHLVTGYKGTADIRLAVEGGELAGLCTGWEAFMKTMNDPELSAEVRKRDWAISPTSGDELQATARELMVQPPEVIEQMKKLLAK